MSGQANNDLNRKPHLWEYFSQLPIPTEQEKKDDEKSPVHPIATYKSDGEIGQQQHIKDLKKINIFVGPNNSGKSRVCREILKSNPQPYRDSLIINKISGLIESFLAEIKTFHDTFSEIWAIMNDGRGTRSRFEYKVLLSNLATYYLRKDEKNVLLQDLTTWVAEYEKADFETDSNINEDLRKVVEMFCKEVSKYLITRNYGSSGRFDPVKAYFQTIRTLRNYDNTIYRYLEKPESNYNAIRDVVSRANSTDNTQLYERNKVFNHNLSEQLKKNSKFLTIETYNVLFHDRNYNNQITIIDGQDFYKILFALKTGADFKQALEFEQFLSENFFGGEEAVLIPNHNDKEQVQIKIGTDKLRKLHELGDGIQQMIILTFPLFFYDYGFLVIEEPEMNLHPGLQKQLMQIYANHPNSDNFVFFIATHSNHIIDSSLDEDRRLTSIYHVEKKAPEGDNPNPTFFIEKRNTGDISLLDSLGVSQSSVYLANGVIWVEGPSDAIYIEKWLNLYAEIEDENGKKLHQKLKKGLHYTIQCLATAAWGRIGFDFEKRSADGKFYWDEPDEIINITNVSQKAYLVIDSDTDLDQDGNRQESKIHHQGENKSSLIKKFRAKFGKDSVWITDGTMENYLYKVANQIGLKGEDFEERKIKDDEWSYHYLKDSKKKTKIAESIYRNKEIQPEDFFGRENDLYKKIQALYDTIAGWNSNDF